MTGRVPLQKSPCALIPVSHRNLAFIQPVSLFPTWRLLCVERVLILTRYPQISSRLGPIPAHCMRAYILFYAIFSAFLNVQCFHFSNTAPTECGQLHVSWTGTPSSL